MMLTNNNKFMTDDKWTMLMFAVMVTVISITSLVAGWHAGVNAVNSNEQVGYSSRDARQGDFAREASEVNKDYAAQWQEARALGLNEAELEEARSIWRRKYNAAMRGVYEKYGREVPAYLIVD